MTTQDETIMGLMYAMTRPDGEPMDAEQLERYFDMILTMLLKRKEGTDQ